MGRTYLFVDLGRGLYCAFGGVMRMRRGRIVCVRVVFGGDIVV